LSGHGFGVPGESGARTRGFTLAPGRRDLHEQAFDLNLGNGPFVEKERERHRLEARNDDLHQAAALDASHFAGRWLGRARLPVALWVSSEEHGVRANPRSPLRQY